MALPGVFGNSWAQAQNTWNELKKFLEGDLKPVKKFPTQGNYVGRIANIEAAANVFWEFVYTGAATYPWSRIGGSALFSTNAGVSGFGNTAPDSTGMPSISVPLAMEADILYGAGFLQNTTAGAGQVNLLAYKNGGATFLHQLPMIINFQFGTVPAGGGWVRTTLPINDGILLARSVGVLGQTGTINTPWIALLPIRAA